ncbi:Phytosulfokines 5 [Hordeum vulgare]|nr:Phytosulfokines 5 [Hordeum vulgare]
MVFEACLAEEMMAVARAAAEEEAICDRILKKRQWGCTHALAREQDRAVYEMVRLPSKEEEELSDDEGNSSDEQIWLDPYCAFDRYFGEKDGKGSGKHKGSLISTIERHAKF